MSSVEAIAKLVTIVSAAFTVAIVGGSKATEAPSPSWTTRAKVLRVIDGDTLEVEIRRTVRVRMIGCWSPEKKVDTRLPKEKQASEKQAGIAAKNRLSELALGKTVILQVPTDPSGDISKSLTMNRVLGTVWLEGDSVSLSQRQVRDGFATEEKREELK